MIIDVKCEKKCFELYVKQSEAPAIGDSFSHNCICDLEDNKVQHKCTLKRIANTCLLDYNDVIRTNAKNEKAYYERGEGVTI